MLSSYFPFASNAPDVEAVDSLPLVRHIGLSCEQEMIDATNVINPQKTATFALGLLFSASGGLVANEIAAIRERIRAEVANVCAGLVARELAHGTSVHTAGERAFIGTECHVQGEKLPPAMKSCVRSLRLCLIVARL